MMLVQRDVTLRMQLERALANLSESQLTLMSQIFPRHFIERISSAPQRPQHSEPPSRSHRTLASAPSSPSSQGPYQVQCEQQGDVSGEPRCRHGQAEATQGPDQQPGDGGPPREGTECANSTVPDSLVPEISVDGTSLWLEDLGSMARSHEQVRHQHLHLHLHKHQHLHKHKHLHHVRLPAVSRVPRGC